MTQQMIFALRLIKNNCDIIYDLVSIVNYQWTSIDKFVIDHWRDNTEVIWVLLSQFSDMVSCMKLPAFMRYWTLIEPPNFLDTCRDGQCYEIAFTRRIDHLMAPFFLYSVIHSLFNQNGKHWPSSFPKHHMYVCLLYLIKTDKKNFCIIKLLVFLLDKSICKMVIFEKLDLIPQLHLLRFFCYAAPKQLKYRGIIVVLVSSL